jgi:hypothetical protein
MSPSEIRARLMELATERLRAECIGPRADGPYMANLEEKTLSHQAAHVRVAVTELAVLRGQLYGRNLG